MSDTLPCGHDRVFRLMGATNGCSACALEEASAEIKRLQAIVNRLPTTADGEPVTPGMDVWEPWPREPQRYVVVWSDFYERFRCRRDREDGEVDWLEPEETYSTEEAAKAAEEKP